MKPNKVSLNRSWIAYACSAFVYVCVAGVVLYIGYRPAQREPIAFLLQSPIGPFFAILICAALIAGALALYCALRPNQSSLSVWVASSVSLLSGIAIIASGWGVFAIPSFAAPLPAILALRRSVA